MLFLVDASVLITANNTYYPIERVPEFWEWLTHQAISGLIKLPLEIFEEVLPGRKNDDLLPDWITDHRDALLLDEAADPALVQRVVNDGYAPDLKDDELEEIGRDPFLIAYAPLRRHERNQQPQEATKEPTNSRRLQYVWYYVLRPILCVQDTRLPHSMEIAEFRTVNTHFRSGSTIQGCAAFIFCWMALVERGIARPVQKLGEGNDLDVPKLDVVVCVWFRCSF